jgi:hypothetical protein
MGKPWKTAGEVQVHTELINPLATRSAWNDLGATARKTQENRRSEMSEPELASWKTGLSVKSATNASFREDKEKIKVLALPLVSNC